MSKKKAIISVSNKEGLEKLTQKLIENNYEIISSGGTGEYLKKNNIKYQDVSNYTGVSEMLDGRVKTLNHQIHAGILYDRNNDDHINKIKSLDIQSIDIVIVNLYPFEEVIANEKSTLGDAIENIDIGGSALIRAAAKNYKFVTVISDISDYQKLIEELDDKEKNSKISLKFREELAIKAFRICSDYDCAISNYLSSSEDTMSHININYPLQARLRYGENPHQSASLYGNFSKYFNKIHGKEPSYTNILDIGMAASLINEFKRITVAIFKHSNPCGVGCSSKSLRSAWEKAYETDKQAPFGGVIVLNRPLTEDLARVFSAIFIDIIIAPEFTPEARAILSKKSNLILIVMSENFDEALSAPIMRSVPGGLLVQDSDINALGLQDIENKVVTDRPPSQDEITSMKFAWKVCKYVKSNSIVFSKNDRTLAIGAGQMSRVDSVKIAVWKAKEAGLSLDKSVIASDAMFPFPDGLEIAIEAGATSVIQTGGSIRDKLVIEAANKKKASMIFTGYRHFLH